MKSKTYLFVDVVKVPGLKFRALGRKDSKLSLSLLSGVRPKQLSELSSRTTLDLGKRVGRSLSSGKATLRLSLLIILFSFSYK